MLREHPPLREIDVTSQKSLKLLHFYLESSINVLTALLEHVVKSEVQLELKFLAQLWFNILKHQLSFLRKDTKVMGKVINSHIRRTMKLLLSSPFLLGVDQSEEESISQRKENITAQCWEVIGSFYPGMMKSLT